MFTIQPDEGFVLERSDQRYRRRSSDGGHHHACFKAVRDGCLCGAAADHRARLNRDRNHGNSRGLDVLSRIAQSLRDRPSARVCHIEQVKAIFSRDPAKLSGWNCSSGCGSRTLYKQVKFANVTNPFSYAKARMWCRGGGGSRRPIASRGKSASPQRPGEAYEAGVRPRA